MEIAMRHGATRTYKGKRIDDDYTYVSVVTEQAGVVQVQELPLEPSLKVCNHSPTGFEWGYSGSGPAQLALAILLDALAFIKPDEDRLLQVVVARRNYQRFKSTFVLHFNKNEWELPLTEIVEWFSMIAEEV